MNKYHYSKCFTTKSQRSSENILYQNKKRKHKRVKGEQKYICDLKEISTKNGMELSRI